MKRQLLGVSVLLTATLALIQNTRAEILFAVQDQNPDILIIDTDTGVATPAFPVPTGGVASMFDGLTLAEGGTSLLYVEGFVGATSPLFRLNPNTGEVLSSHPLSSVSGFRAGLSFDSANSDSIFVLDDGLGVGQQLGFGGPYHHPFVDNNPLIPGALGGDDFGRHFVINFGGDFADDIQEFCPWTGVVLNSLPVPGESLNFGGLAFDGKSLYVVDSANTLFTVNPNTGAVLNSVPISGGNGLIVSGLAATSQVTPLDEQIQNILDFIDDSVEAGDLSGSGPGKSAANRLNALKNMIEAAGDLIEAEEYEAAFDQLDSAYRKCDGKTPPPDFVQGDARVELANLILDLMADLALLIVSPVSF